MSPEVVHARADFREHPGLRFLQRESQLYPRCPPVAATPEPGSELSRVDLVTAPNANLGQAGAGLLEQDGELLAADGVQLVDRAVRLVRRRATVPQPGLADRSPDEAVAEFVMQTLEDPPLHPQRRGRPAFEEAAREHDRVGAQLHQLGSGT